MPLRRQVKVIQLFNNLLAAGFNLTEMVDFLSKSQLLEATYVQRMRSGLLKGQSLSQIMGEIGFSDQIITQLSLAESHGNLEKTLTKVEAYLTQLVQVRKKLVEVATYPLILLTFLVVIMLGLKNYLLPQLEEETLASRLINHFPTIFLWGLVGLLLMGLLIRIWSKKQSRLVLYSRAARLPLLGTFVRQYVTAYYAREWGNLIGQGLELSQIVSLMQTQPSPFFQEMGRDLEKALLSGQLFHQKVLDYPFFLRELSLIIEYGEVKSKLGSELTIYADEAWSTFFSKVTKATQLIQPLIFILVALMIVMIYAAMLMPMYQSMEVHI